MPIVWRKQLATGNDIIDRDHKYLFCLFNSIELALTTPDALIYLPVYFEQLFEYSREHFDREEKIQLRVGYPNPAEHKQQHQQILSSLEEINTELQQLVSKDNDEATLKALQTQFNKDLLNLSREWVLEHMIKSDRLMEPYLKKYPKDFM